MISSSVTPFSSCPLNLSWHQGLVQWVGSSHQIRSDQISHPVVSDSLQPHESQHARPPCPSPTPGVHWDSYPSTDDQTVITQLSRPLSRDWACTIHVADHTLITWWSCTYHLDIMHWSRGWSYTVHVSDHALITWLIMQWSCSYHVLVPWVNMHWTRNWSCTDHVADHALNTWLIMHWSRDWSCTAHVAIMHC